MNPRIRINLSSEPFLRTRPVIVGSTAAGVLLLGLLALLISLSVMERGQADEAQHDIARLEKQLARMNAEQTRLEGELRLACAELASGSHGQLTFGSRT